MGTSADSHAKPVRGQFIWRTGKDRLRVVNSIKQKIDSGYFSSREVLSELTERLGPDFEGLLSE